MSVKAMSHVFDHSPYRGTERLIHLAIADVVNDGYDYQFWMSQKRVAAKARCSRQTVNIAIKKMVKDGCLSVVENPGGHSPNVYKFVMSEVSGIKTPETDGVGFQDTSVSGFKTPSASSPITRTKQEQDTAGEEEIPPPSKPAKKTRAKRDYTANAYTEIENAIWDAYPKHSHPNKALTIRHVRGWVAEDDGAEQAILAAAQVYASDVVGTDFEFIRRAYLFFDPANEKCNWREFAERGQSVITAVEWEPDADMLVRGRIWDEWDEHGYWYNTAGESVSQHPQQGGIKPPVVVIEGVTWMVDRQGHRYTLKHEGGRKYLQNVTIGAQGFAPDVLAVSVDDAATSSNLALTEAYSAQEADLGN